MEPENKLAASSLLLLQIDRGAPIEAVESLLESGADVNGHQHHDYCPLMIAADKGHVSVTRMLIDRGADLDAPAPRDVIDANGVVMILKGARALHCSILLGQLGTARVLIQAGADVNACDSRGHTPLMSTFLGRDVPRAFTVQMARELLQAGADASLASIDAGVALHFAVAPESTADTQQRLCNARHTALHRGSHWFGRCCFAALGGGGSAA